MTAPSSKKRKKTAGGAASGSTTAVQDAAGVNGAGAAGMTIELLASFEKLRKSWPKDMVRLLDPSLPDERRSELWEIMCDGGDKLRQRFAWAIPDERALRIIKHFGPIVEVGSGLGYWAMLLRARGVDINAYDKVAGAPDCASFKSTNNMSTSKKKDKEVEGAASPGNGSGDKEEMLVAEDVEEDETPSFWIMVNKGGPSVLEEPCNKERSLFLCYPDDFEGETESLGLRCLQAFEGDVVIHVGELFGDSVSMTPGQSPWGRTTSRECQEELSSKFHCILKVSLPSWPHSRDTLTVWKRHSFCAIHYGDDSDEGDSGDADVATPQRKGAVKGDECNDPSSSINNNSGATRRVGGASEGGREGDADDDVGHDDEAESHLSGSDSSGLMEGLPVGMPDVDMYAFVPADERMPYEQAAPCVRFLLDEQA